MKVQISAVGKAKGNGPEKSLFEHYIKRLKWAFSLKEVEEKKNLSTPQRMENEAELLLQTIPHGAKIIVLDERGKGLSSVELAEKISSWQDDGVSDLVFAIGGADGHHDKIRDKADLLLAFGKLTWPHMLVRAMLAEQIYRVQTIIEGHPYHRE